MLSVILKFSMSEQFYSNSQIREVILPLGGGKMLSRQRVKKIKSRIQPVDISSKKK